MDIMCFWVAFFLFPGLLWKVALSDQDGFLSLTCGGTANYTDASNISWISDNEYISTGNTTTINYTEGASSFSVPVRFFPVSQAHNCYKLPVNNVPSLVLVRAQFVYKNYDGLGKPPSFSVSLGTAVVSTIDLKQNDPWIEEFVWSVDKDIVSFCLHNIPNQGVPAISSIEVRPLPQGAYTSGMEDFPNKSLRKSYRIDCGYTNGSLRYPLDPYDRIWDADQSFTPVHISTGFQTQIISFNVSGLKEDLTAAILQTARVLGRRDVLTYNLSLDTLADYYIVLYFAGILPVSPSFDVLINRDVAESNYTVRNSEVSALYITQREVKSLNITLKSISFYPQVNAIEVYEILDIPEEASSTTVSALQIIQQSSGLDLGWQGDPCSPIKWDQIECEENKVTSLELSDINLRSISPAIGDLLDLKTLDLHNTSLTGEIQNFGSLTRLEKLNLSFNLLTSFGTEFDNLISLQILDLQNNSLQGMVPDSLGVLEDLHLLNVENNKLQGALPQSLNRESLEIRASGNLCLSFSTMSCNDFSVNSSIETPQVTIVARKKHRKHIHVVLVLGAIGGALLAALIVATVSALLYVKKKRTNVTSMEKSMSDMRNWNSAKVFSHKEMKVATNNFKEVIGRGSFGSVYLGKLRNGRMVAVKVRFDKSLLGTDSFINEVHLLSRIRHQNLVCFEGFCYESKQQILVYEYLPNGSLADHLYGPKSKKISLSWVRRLKIAVDAAKGLDYLHNGNEPRIIHRDVKCSNILLDKEMNAKVCDFGLCKQVLQADASHVTTVVKGTAGYLDPEYYTTQQLTEKSDVYSFGVVLLELICGREPLSHTGTPDSFNLVLWAKPYLQADAYEIVDESLEGTFDIESMRKTTLVAIRSVERDASQRPTIQEVLAELKEAFSIQLSYLQCRNM